MKLTLIGHSTVLFEIGGRRFLTDPYFGRALPLYRSIRRPAMTSTQLKDVDVVLVSHGHFDHMDRPFMWKLPGSCTVVTPRGPLSKGLRAWEKMEIYGVEIVAVPARHMPGSIGYILRAEGKTVYFAGDTFSGDFMKVIGQRYKPDLALMPVTTYRIPMTMGETQAVDAVGYLGVKRVIPIHLDIEPVLPFLRNSQSVEGFQKRLYERRGDEVTVTWLKNGESVEI